METVDLVVIGAGKCIYVSVVCHVTRSKSPSDRPTVLVLAKR